MLNAFVYFLIFETDAKIQALGVRPNKWMFDYNGNGNEIDPEGDAITQAAKKQEEIPEEMKREQSATSNTGSSLSPTAPMDSRSNGSTSLSPPRPEGETGTVLTFDCRNNEPPSDDDLNGGLSSVISTTGGMGSMNSMTNSTIGSGSSVLVGSSRSLKSSKNVDAQKNAEGKYSSERERASRIWKAL